MKWTQLEKDKLLEFAWASDHHLVDDFIQEARKRLYLSGEYPEFKERSISACKQMFYQQSNQIRSSQNDHTI